MGLWCRCVGVEGVREDGVGAEDIGACVAEACGRMVLGAVGKRVWV